MHLNVTFKHLHCAVQSLKYQMVLEPNWLVQVTLNLVSVQQLVQALFGPVQMQILM